MADLRADLSLVFAKRSDVRMYSLASGAYICNTGVTEGDPNLLTIRLVIFFSSVCEITLFQSPEGLHLCSRSMGESYNRRKI